jgi:hypothetical protein
VPALLSRTSATRLRVVHKLHIYDRQAKVRLGSRPLDARTAFVTSSDTTNSAVSARSAESHSSSTAPACNRAQLGAALSAPSANGLVNDQRLGAEPTPEPCSGSRPPTLGDSHTTPGIEMVLSIVFS